MNVDNNLRLLRGSDIEILTIATRGDEYDIMVFDNGTKIDLDASSNDAIFVEDEVLQRLNITDVTLEGVLDVEAICYLIDVKYFDKESEEDIMALFD